MHRRQFLQAPLAVPAAMITAAAARAIDPIPRTGGPLLKLSIAAYSFRDQLDGKKPPAMTLDDFVDLAATYGVDAVEPTSYYFKDTSREYLARLKGRCTRLGLDISGGAVGNRFTESDPAKLREEIRKTKEWTERYALLGAKTMRIFAGNAVKDESLEQTRRRCIDAIMEVCDHAARFGIYMALENHGGIVSTAQDLLAIVRAVRHDWFGVNLDTGNFHTDDPYADLAIAAPYAVTVQVKTEIQRQGKKKEPADLAKVVEILKKANYRGYLALEYEAPEDPFTAIPSHIATLGKAVASSR
jgi:sugar phosphate isomerase/epimerase